MLPCADIDEIAAFGTSVGFEVTFWQERPYPYCALEGHGFAVHYYVIGGHTPEASHSTCGVLVDDTGALYDALAAGLKARYGKVPVAGFPRITRPRARKNVEWRTGFSLIDPAGNWIRFFRRGQPEQVVEESPLRAAVNNAVVLADSKDDPAQALKILRGALNRAAPGDEARGDAEEFLAELEERRGDA